MTAPDSQAPPIPENQFLDPHDLIGRSQPLPRSGWMFYLLGGFLFVVLMSTFAGRQSPELQGAVRLLGGLTMVGLMVLLSVLTGFSVNRQREEQRRLEELEELVQLRRWPQAGLLLQGMLSRPTRSPQTRAQGLVYLSTVLARQGRHADAMIVQEHLLEHMELDPGLAYAMRLSHTMAMLQQDHLVDAHRALGELRRVEGSEKSAGLALVEIYRDVKTGHPAEAIEIFKQKLPELRDQLGHRVADAWALVAKAYDMVDQEAEARQAYLNASLLGPIAEISRRYGEVASLTGKYAPAEAPNE